EPCQAVSQPPNQETKSNPILPENINRIRGLKQKATENLKLPSFEGTFEDTAKRSLSLKPVYRKAQHQEVIQTISGEETTSDATTSHPFLIMSSAVLQLTPSIFNSCNSCNSWINS